MYWFAAWLWGCSSASKGQKRCRPGRISQRYIKQGCSCLWYATLLFIFWSSSFSPISVQLLPVKTDKQTERAKDQDANDLTPPLGPLDGREGGTDWMGRRWKATKVTTLQVFSRGLKSYSHERRALWYIPEVLYSTDAFFQTDEDAHRISPQHLPPWDNEPNSKEGCMSHGDFNRVITHASCQTNTQQR